MRVLFGSVNCYFDNSNGAMIASRSLMMSLKRSGFITKAFTGSYYESLCLTDNETNIANDKISYEQNFTAYCMPNPSGQSNMNVRTPQILHQGINVMISPYNIANKSVVSNTAINLFLKEFTECLQLFNPDIFISFGGDEASMSMRRITESMGIFNVFNLHNFNYKEIDSFKNCNSVTVPSKFAQSYYMQKLCLSCDVIPNSIDLDRAKACNLIPKYLTFVNPVLEKGVYPFVKIAELLGKQRPEIPLLVVESRGGETDLVSCGIDLRKYNNVNLMSHTDDPKHFWRVTKLALLPSLWWENQPLVAIEAMVNGIPVIASKSWRHPRNAGRSWHMFAPTGKTNTKITSFTVRRRDAEMD